MTQRRLQLKARAQGVEHNMISRRGLKRYTVGREQHRRTIKISDFCAYAAVGLYFSFLTSAYAAVGFVRRAVSGPDFRPDQGRGRRHSKSPILLPKKFMKMMARRSPACIQSDWTVVPAVRASTWKWECEHIFALDAPHIQPGEGAADT